MTAWHRRGMLLTRSSRRLTGSALQASWRIWNSSTSLFGRRVLHLLSRIAQRFSMGLRSGDCDGQSIRGMLLSCIQSLTTWAVCFGSLSCWKYQFSRIKVMSALGSMTFSRMFKYPSFTRMPSILCSMPTPDAVNAPQTFIFLSCFTVPTVHSGLYRSLRTLQTRFFLLNRKTKGN